MVIIKYIYIYILLLQKLNFLKLVILFKSILDSLKKIIQIIMNYDLICTS